MSERRYFRLLGIVVAGFLLVACDRLGVGGTVAEDVLFQDDFSDPLAGNWHLEGDEQGQAAIVDGQLVVHIQTPATAQFVTLDEQIFTDFLLDVEATQIGGQVGGSYGVLVRMTGPGQFYRFEVTSNGEYVVERHDEAGNWERLTEDWQSSPAILQGLNETNRLRVAAAGSTLSFYANETLLAQVIDGTYERGAVALDAGTFNQSEMQVAFDNVVLRRP
ncbi:MAG: family 16 glycoside hydrolase [Chloroflexota bacterium]